MTIEIRITEFEYLALKDYLSDVYARANKIAFQDRTIEGMRVDGKIIHQATDDIRKILKIIV